MAANQAEYFALEYLLSKDPEAINLFSDGNKITALHCLCTSSVPACLAGTAKCQRCGDEVIHCK
jgi:hypothetical protein